MSSDNDKYCNSTETDSKKNMGSSYMGDDNVSKAMDEMQSMNVHSMRYHQNGEMKAQPYYPTRVMGHYDNWDNGAHRQSPLGMTRNATSDDSDLADAMIFLNKIKDEYKDSLPVYDSFLETMRDFKFGKIDADEVCKSVRMLFKDKAFLIRRFEDYLPQYLQYNSDSGRVVNGNMHMPYDRKYSKFHMMNYNNNGQGPAPMGRMMGINRPVQPPHIGAYMNTRVRASPSGIQGSSGYKNILNENNPETSSKHKIANDFIQLVKTKYASNPYVYKQFIEILQNSKNGFDKLFSQVSALLADSPDLIEKFEVNFRPSGSSESVTEGGEGEALKYIKRMLAKKGLLEEFVKIINFYNQNYLSADDLVLLLEPIIDDKESMDAFKTFIKYEDYGQRENNDRYENLNKIGSYRIYPEGHEREKKAPIIREVLNNMCFSVSTLDGENSYVFREKNSSEDLLVRIDDERACADLKIGRFRYLIGRLEELYTQVGEESIELEDIEMSAPVIKETLKKVYDNKSTEVLEAILSNPSKAIPVVLNRLYKVYRETVCDNRMRRKYWRELVEEHYYRAYDIKGVMYKSEERNLLSMKHIFTESKTPVQVKMDDIEIVQLIKTLFGLFAEHNNRILYRKYEIQAQVSFFDEIITKITSEEEELSGGFDLYALLFYIMTLYTRFKKVKELNLSPITVNKVAVDIGLAKGVEVTDRFKAVVNAAEEVVCKVIDADIFEEKIRQLTDSHGYHLHNLKKIMSRVEKQVIYLLDLKNNTGHLTFPGEYNILVKDGVLTIKQVEKDTCDLIDAVEQ